MKNALIGLTIALLVSPVSGCGGGTAAPPTPAEVKRNDEKMQKLETDLSTQLPAKVD